MIVADIGLFKMQIAPSLSPSPAVFVDYRNVHLIIS